MLNVKTSLGIMKKLYEVSMAKKSITISLLKKEILQDFFSSVLVLSIIITGCANQIGGNGICQIAAGYP